MQQNKYLDDLGISSDKYGTNFVEDTDKRSAAWAKEREVYGFDGRECWDLCVTFAEWLYSHIMKFREDAVVVDLNYHKFTFEGREYTQNEAMDFILERVREFLLARDTYAWTDEEVKLFTKLQEATRMWATILPAMWW